MPRSDREQPSPSSPQQLILRLLHLSVQLLRSQILSRALNCKEGKKGGTVGRLRAGLPFAPVQH